MLLPPFSEQSAIQKVRMAEDAWNSRDPQRVSQVYSLETRWRNRSENVQGRDAVVAFLSRKWAKELDYRLIKELWAWHEDRLAVRFAYEWHDDSGNWFRSYGNENWRFGADGLMIERFACINDLPITASERRFHWPLGRRPDNHPGLSSWACNYDCGVRLRLAACFFSGCGGTLPSNPVPARVNAEKLSHCCHWLNVDDDLRMLHLPEINPV